MFTIEVMLLFLNQTDTSKYIGQLESQFVSDINIIVFHFVVPNQLFYPLLYKCFSEIHSNILRVEGKVSGLELKNEKQ